MATLQVLFLLGCVVAASTSDVLSNITYDCLPDGIIHIHGVHRGYTLTSLTAGNACHVTQISTHDFALGQYCTQSVYHSYPYYRNMYQADIQLIHSTSHVIGGNGYDPFRLICDPIHSGGKVFEVVTSYGVRDRSASYNYIPTLPSARKSKQERRYVGTPTMIFSENGFNRTGHFPHYTSGTLSYLLIESGSPHFVIRPENCTATEWDPRYYQYTGVSVDLWDVTKDRCVLEPYLMEKFTSINSDQTAVAAPVYAFHFGATSNNHYRVVYFECSVRVCSRGSFSCSLDITFDAWGGLDEQTYDTGILEMHGFDVDSNVCDDVRREGRSAEEEDEDDYEHHLLTGTLTIEHEASGSDRGRFSLFTTLLGVVAVVLCRK